MMRLIGASDEQYQLLREKIQGMQYIWDHLELPPACTPSSCSLYIQYTPQAGYVMSISDNIFYDGNSETFRMFLQHGEVSFDDYQDLIDFIRGLRTAFEPGDRRQRPQTQAAEAVEQVEPPSQIFIDRDKLYEYLTAEIIGQDASMRKLTDAVRIHLAKVAPKRPMSLFLAGPTGVGKTESINRLVKGIREITSKEYQCIRVDCNQLVEGHQVSKLFGTSPGYVGYGDDHMLKPLSNNPQCIIHFDEIEKAHSAILTTMMNAMDRGVVQVPKAIDGKFDLDCKHAIFAFTSNLPISKRKSKLGFCHADEEDTSTLSEEESFRDNLVNSGVLPEIVGRIGHFIQFEELSQTAMSRIIELEIIKIAKDFGLSLTSVSDSIIHGLLSQTNFGVRTFKHLVERILGNMLVDYAQYADTDLPVLMKGTVNSPQLVPCRSQRFFSRFLSV